MAGQQRRADPPTETGYPRHRGPPLAVLGCVALTLGGLVYVLGRPPDSVPGLTDLLARDRSLVSLGTWAGSFPTFAHVLGWSLLTLAVLRLRGWTRLLVPGSWLLINALFELGQGVRAFPGPVVPGVFDPQDLAGAALGALAAVAIILVSTRREVM